MLSMLANGNSVSGINNVSTVVLDKACSMILVTRLQKTHIVSSYTELFHYHTVKLQQILPMKLTFRKVLTDWCKINIYFNPQNANLNKANHCTAGKKSQQLKLLIEFVHCLCIATKIYQSTEKNSIFNQMKIYCIHLVQCNKSMCLIQ